MATHLLKRPFVACKRSPLTFTTPTILTSSLSSHSPSSISSFLGSHPRSFSSYAITPLQLKEALEQKPASTPRIIPLCAAWFMPNDPEKRDGYTTFIQSRIPNARFFDLDAVKDAESPYPHMLPIQEVFEESMQKLGINRDDRVVVYDAQETGLFSAPRVGWTLKVFGHEKVHLLNNFKLWVQAGYPTESGEPAPVQPSKYQVSTFSPELVVNFAEMKHIAKNNIAQEKRKEAESTEPAKGEKEAQKEESKPATKAKEDEQVIDARATPRWTGAAPEPRADLPSGHIPGSQNLPFSELLDPETKTLYPAEKLREIFASKEIDPEKPVISSCGTGVTAAILDAAFEESNYVPQRNRRLYDGSWT